MMESKSCNIVLLPNAELASKAIEASRSIKNDKTYFTLEDGAFYPHVSIYMLELKVATYEKVREVLECQAILYSQFNLSAVRFDQTMGFIYAEYNVTPELANFQDSTVDALNPLRNGMREKDMQRMENAEGIKRLYFETYGYPNIKELFRPHLTLTRFDNDESYDTTLLPAISDFSGSFDRVGFFESGDNGTCIKLISSFSLQR